MADGNANVLTPEPIFYGDMSGKTMAPEDFLRKMENIKGSTTPPMADEAAVKKAVSYLRGWAADWWCDSIELTMPERKEAASWSWPPLCTGSSSLNTTYAQRGSCCTRTTSPSPTSTRPT